MCTFALAEKDEGSIVVVETGTTRGRATLAMRDFEVGDIIMREEPILIWDQSDTDLLRQYLSAPKSTKSAIEDLAHMPLSSPTPRVQALRNRAQALLDFFSQEYPSSSISLDEVHKLLLIANTNLHHYFGHAPQLAEVASERLSADAFALFPKAAKVNHACAPNAMYTTQTADGQIQYTAIRDVRQGDEISFSYLSEDGETLSRDRRAELLAERDIRCECDRCLAPDWWRGLRCPKSGCDGIAFATLDTTDHSDRWQCSTCGGLTTGEMTERLQQEASVRHDIQAFTELCYDFDETLPNPLALGQLLANAEHALAATHSLICQGHLLLSKVYASYAHRLEQGREMSGRPASVRGAAECRLASAAADVRAALLSEMIAAGQHDCRWDERTVRYALRDGGNVEGQPLLECARMLFEAGQSLLKVPQDRRDEAIASVVRRYLRTMRLRYGADDPDVLDIARAVGGACEAG